MGFEIENGMPYLIIDGMAYQAEIKDGQVKYDPDSGTLTEATGRYSLYEIMAKCGNNSPAQKKGRKKQEAESGLC